MMETDSAVSYCRKLHSTAFLFTRIFCAVLEFSKNSRFDFARADGGRDSRGVGICDIYSKRKKCTLYHLCCAYVAAFSGDNALELSDA